MKISQSSIYYFPHKKSLVHAQSFQWIFQNPWEVHIQTLSPRSLYIYIYIKHPNTFSISHFSPFSNSHTAREKGLQKAVLKLFLVSFSYPSRYVFSGTICHSHWLFLPLNCDIYACMYVSVWFSWSYESLMSLSICVLDFEKFDLESVRIRIRILRF